MTTMQWIAFTIGLLLLATRLPALIWPGPYRRTVLDILQGSGRTLIRALGGFLLLLVVTIAALLLRTLTLLQGVLLLLAILCAGAGAVAITQPDGYRLFSERLLARLPDWALRCAAAFGVALGGWLVYLSLKSA